VGDPTDAIDIGAATLKDNTALHDAIQKAFDDLVSTGDYENILSTWGQESLAYNGSN